MREFDLIVTGQNVSIYVYIFLVECNRCSVVCFRPQSTGWNIHCAPYWYTSPAQWWSSVYLQPTGPSRKDLPCTLLLWVCGLLSTPSPDCCQNRLSPHGCGLCRRSPGSNSGWLPQLLHEDPKSRQRWSQHCETPGGWHWKLCDAWEPSVWCDRQNVVLWFHVWCGESGGKWKWKWGDTCEVRRWRTGWTVCGLWQTAVRGYCDSHTSRLPLLEQTIEYVEEWWMLGKSDTRNAHCNLCIFAHFGVDFVKQFFSQTKFYLITS